MPGIFTSSELEALTAPHVARFWLARLDLPSGVAYLHNGAGKITIDDQEWVGVSDPIGGRLISIGQVQEPAFGQASAVSITLTGANIEFVKSVHSTRKEIEGRRADIYFATVDQETQKILISPVALFGRGKMTAPAIQWSGIGTRTVSLTVESIWSTFNFAPGGVWNNADQQRRYSGDLGFQFVGQKTQEVWT